MAKHHREHSSDDDRDGGDGGEDKGDDDHLVHLDIEDRRFQGGLPPTPELYALALEQWNRLPGAVMRPATDPAPPGEDGGAS